MVVRDSLVVCCAGIVVGLPLAVAGSRFLETMLFGLTPRDPWSYAGALVAVALLAVVASLVPARRAVSVDPMIALRRSSVAGVVLWTLPRRARVRTTTHALMPTDHVISLVRPSG